MALPEGMSEFEHLQSVIMHTYNPLVQAAFRDDIPENDINTPESALKYACLIKDEDTAAIMAVRMLNFYFTRGEVDITDKIYGIPILDVHRYIKFQPQITLKFKESKADAKLHQRQTRPARFRISFRIPQLNETTVTDSQIHQWSTHLKTLFPTTFYHTLGMDSRSYKDDKLGVSWNIRAMNKMDVIELIEKVLNFMEFIKNHSQSTYSGSFNFQGKLLRSHSPEVDTPQQETIHFPGLDETYHLENGFKGVKVRLHKAELSLHGRLKCINLLTRYV
jgi:hypothetical protein